MQAKNLDEIKCLKGIFERNSVLHITNELNINNKTNFLDDLIYLLYTYSTYIPFCVH